MTIFQIPTRPLQRTGRVAGLRSQALEVFGWPCKLCVELDSGEFAYLLDLERCTRAPQELLRLTEATVAVCGPETPVRVSLIPVFQRLIILRMEPRDDPGAVSAGRRRRPGIRDLGASRSTRVPVYGPPSHRVVMAG